jgi:alkylation response protein AidB-like acyl-CoA dehydrogenase
MLYRSPFLDLLEPLAPRIAERAAKHDREGSFPFENFEELREAGYLKLTIPTEFGGLGGTILDFAQCQDFLGQADGGTALGVNMHLMTTGIASEARHWPPHLYEEVCRNVVAKGWLANTVATEPELGSPQGGGKPDTTARLKDGHWVVNGRKTYTSLAPLLHYHITLCTVVDSGDPPEVVNLLIERGTPGLRIDETWDTIGMRATASHDVVFEDASVAEDRVVGRRRLGERDPRGDFHLAWFPLSVGAVYTGVAQAARDFAYRYAAEREPTGLGKPIGDLPTVRARLARMDILLLAARTLLYDAAQDWLDAPERRSEIVLKVAAAKILATNNAIEVTDLAMRVVGGEGLFRKNPLERYLRDARGGLYNPPLDDRGFDMLAKAGLARFREAPGQ